ERLGLLRQQWLREQLVTGQLLLAGHADEADAANEHALQVGLAADIPDAFGSYGGVMYNIRWHQGRVDEIAEFMLDCARDSPSIAALRAVVPMLLCEAGRIEDARERLAAEAAAGFDFPYDGSWLNEMFDLLDAAASTASADAARMLIERVAPYARQVVSPAAV